jgi:hypothetical protein
MYGIVQVIKDGKKLRVKPIGKSGFVRFPKSLRFEEGDLFEVTELKKSKGKTGGKFWIAAGDIRILRRGRRLKFRTKSARNINA